MRIPTWPISNERETELIAEVLAHPQWGGFNPIVARFEEQFAAAHQSKFGITAANGTVSLEMALACLGVGPGDEVIVPAITFISTATAVSRVGATPVFVDIEPYTFNMDPKRAAEAIGPKTKGIIPVHFGGALADMDALMALANQHGLFVLEDAAHAHGSEWCGRRAGSIGQMSSFSFQNGKVMTAGEGGIVLTSDEELATQLRSFANQGRRLGHSHFLHFTLGTNLRLGALQAAVLIAQLERLSDQIETRTRNAALLKQELQDVPGLRWQEIDARVTRNSWYLMVGRIEKETFGMDRDEFCKTMREAGAPFSPYYPHTLYRNPLYANGGCRVMDCPNAEATIGDSFWLAHNALLAEEETIREIARAVRGCAMLVK